MPLYDVPTISRSDLEREIAFDADIDRMRRIWSLDRTELSFEDWMDELAESGALADYYERKER